MMSDQGLHKRNIRDQTTIMGNSHWKQKHILICTKGPSINYVVSAGHLIEKQQGKGGVKNCLFWDDIVYGRPPKQSSENTSNTLHIMPGRCDQSDVIYQVDVHADNKIMSSKLTYYAW